MHAGPQRRNERLHARVIFQLGRLDSQREGLLRQRLRILEAVEDFLGVAGRSRIVRLQLLLFKLLQLVDVKVYRRVVDRVGC